MIKFLYKYGAFLFMLNTILFSTIPFTKYAHYIFYLLMGIYGLIIIIDFKRFMNIMLLKPFMILMLINIINFLHFVFFDHNLGSFIYFITKITVFYIIALSIVYNKKYYETTFFRHLIIIGAIVAITSIIYDPHFSINYQGIIGNRNEFALLLSTTFGVFYLYKDRLYFKDYLFLLLLLALILMSGSRNALIGIIIALFIRHGFNPKLLFGILLFLLIYFILNKLGIQTTINRLMEEKDVLFDRRLEWYYAFETFKNKFLTGYGLDHYAYIDQNLVPVIIKATGNKIMAHNSYLAAMVQYGIIFVTLVFSIILFYVLKIYKGYLLLKDFIEEKSVKIYFFILNFTLISSIFESHMFGVNAFHGFMFWFSISILSYQLYFLKRNFNEI